MCRWVRRTIGIMSVAIVANVGFAGAQAIRPDTARVLVRDILTQAPLLKDTMTVIEDADYAARVRDLLSALSVPDSTVQIRTSIDATRVLERMLAPDTVSIRLESDPPGFTVRYYRIVDGPEVWSTATTDTILRLPAGLYRFGFLNSATGEIRNQGRACVEDCRLRWRF